MDLEAMASLLEASGDYRVLRKLKPASQLTTVEGAHHVGLLVDVETTGLDARTDEIIELAMVRFAYDDFGRILAVGESFQGFRQPSIPIPAKVTELTGITDAMVAGHFIDASAVAAFASSATVVVAHNAAFDRRFLERFSDVFRTKPWACSMSQIDWASEGFEGTKLAYLAGGSGFFYDKHRAVNDCVAAIELLTRVLPRSGVTAWWKLVERARRPSWRVRAEGAPFDLKTCSRRVAIAGMMARTVGRKRGGLMWTTRIGTVNSAISEKRSISAMSISAPSKSTHTIAFQIAAEPRSRATLSGRQPRSVHIMKSALSRLKL